MKKLDLAQVLCDISASGAASDDQFPLFCILSHVVTVVQLHELTDERYTMPIRAQFARE